MAKLSFSNRLRMHLSLYVFVALALSCTYTPDDSSLIKPQPGQENTDSTIEEMPEPIMASEIGGIPPPAGYQRTVSSPSSFGQYLRSVALITDNDTVFQHDGEPKSRQDVHHAILTIDVGTRDLQQCADACMRLRGEYLFAQKRYDEIHFNFLSDNNPRYYEDHADSEHSHKSFRKYMDYIFSYANTASLRRELQSVSVEDMQIGDIFIQQGRPYGHAVIVVDMAENSEGKKIFMVAQSYMPAQDIHILKNFNDSSISPWYSMDFGDSLITPQWDFYPTDLKRF
jgi:hypothetical protein